MAACSYTASSSSWLSLGTYAPSYLGGFSSAIGALVVGEVAAAGTDSAEAALERRAGMKGAARLARHQEVKTNGQNTVPNFAINAPRRPAPAYPGEAEAGDHEAGIRLRVVLAPARWRAIAPSPIAMDEEASWRRLGAQVLWYRRDNLASNLKLLAVTQLVRNRIRAA